MSVSEILVAQWAVYSSYHGSRFNLLLHIVVVPSFMAANVVLVASLVQRQWVGAILAVGVMTLSLGLQAHGHRQEKVRAKPFTSLIGAVPRLFLEQWVTFPRFVITGGWWRALRQSSAS